MDDRFSRTLLRAMVLMMMADGHGTDAELATVVDWYGALTGRAIDPEQVRQGMDRLSDDTGFWAAVRSAELPEQQAEDILRACIGVLIADAQLDNAEVETLARMAKALGVRGKRLRELMSEMWRAEREHDRQWASEHFE